MPSMKHVSAPFSRAGRIIQALIKHYPAKGMVDLGTPEDTLIATLLSARTRDEQVLKVYPKLRKAFPTLQAFAKADARKIASYISSIGLYKNKAKFIKALAIRVIEVYGGQVPNRLEDLVTLPGVGRKTASCVLWYGFGIPAVAVDTHVFRISHRLGWARGKTPETVEQELMVLVPKRCWGDMNRVFVQFGREICKSGRPDCFRCPVAKWCAFRPKTAEPKK